MTFTPDELAMLHRHCDLSGRNTGYELHRLLQRIEDQKPRRATASQKRRRETLVRRLAVYQGAAAKLQALIDAGPGFPGLLDKSRWTGADSESV